MSKSELTAETTEEMLEVLSGKDYDIACHLHELGKSLDCKIESKTGARSYKIVYSTKKPKRSLFTIECNEKKWRVKANLFHLNTYKDAVEECSKTIKDSITKTRTCKKCNSKCIGGSSFELDGKSYLTCIGSGHYFANMEEMDWKNLEKLITKENNIMQESV
ncbi:hypothetical protein REL06_016055 [Clostridioides difficile]|nr:hypothetical protein [Clostridioides difficile]